MIKTEKRKSGVSETSFVSRFNGEKRQSVAGKRMIEGMKDILNGDLTVIKQQNISAEIDKLFK